MINDNYKICDVIKFFDIESFAYDKEHKDTIQLDKEYIIVDLVEDMIVISDGILEFILPDLCMQFCKKVRSMRFRIGERLKILDISKFKFTEEVCLEEGGIYKVVDVTLREGTPIIFDGEMQIALFPEEMLFVQKVRQPRKKTNKVKAKTIYTPVNEEIDALQKDILKYMTFTLIDKLLDERNFELLKVLLDNNEIGNFED